MCDGVRRSAAELHRLVIVFELSPFNVWLDYTGPDYPAGWDPVWNLWFTVSRRDDVVAPGPVRGYGAEGSEGALVAPPGFCKADELEDTGNRFRSCVLVVMSHARCRCATPVKGCCVF